MNALQILVFGLAYLDPGSGSVVIQLIIGTLLGSIFILKTYWKKVSNFIQKLFSKQMK